MSHTSSTFLAPFQHTAFTPDTIVFFGFPSGSEGEREAERFTRICDEKAIAYDELFFERSSLWHYAKCYEIEVGSYDEVEAITPVIMQFGELNALALPDETVVALRTREDLHALHGFISQVAKERSC